MITAAQFKHNVKHQGLTKKLKSPGRIMFIHAALEAYESAKIQGLPPIQQLSYLHEVDKQCRKWLDEKKGKTSSKSSDRGTHVLSLMMDVAGETQARFPDLLKALTAFRERKEQYNGDGPAMGPVGVYAHERAVYESNKAAGKYANPAAPRITGSATLMGGGVMYALDDPKYPARAAEYKKSFVRPFIDGGGRLAQLNEAQFREVDRLCSGQINMLYMSKVQRLQHMILVETGLLKWPNGTPITLIQGASVLKELNESLYAVDKYGNFFVTLVRQDIQQNHTTLCAGGEVLCAGNLSIKNGHLRAISNNSGHYAPNGERLKQAILALADAGVPMDNVVVVDCSGGRKLETTGKLFLGGGKAQFAISPVPRLLAATN